MLFWTNPGSSTLQNSSYKATYLLSYKPSKLDQQENSEHCWRSKDKHKQYSPMDFYTWTRQCWSTSKNFYSLDLCRDWMLSRGPYRHALMMMYMTKYVWNLCNFKRIFLILVIYFWLAYSGWTIFSLFLMFTLLFSSLLSIYKCFSFFKNMFSYNICINILLDIFILWIWNI